MIKVIRKSLESCDNFSFFGSHAKFLEHKPYYVFFYFKHHFTSGPTLNYTSVFGVLENFSTEQAGS